MQFLKSGEVNRQFFGKKSYVTKQTEEMLFT